MTTRAGKPASGRRFTLLDGMIVVAAVAASLACLRWVDSKGNPWSLFREVAWDFAGDWAMIEQFASGLLTFAAPPAVAATLALLAMRLRQPRPRWRRLARQPGLAACLALVLGWSAGAAFTVVNVLAIDRATPEFKDGTTYAQQAWVWALAFAEWGSILGGFAVLVAWSSLALAGRWRAEPTWLDRLGRLAGLGWVAMACVAAYLARATSP